VTKTSRNPTTFSPGWPARLRSLSSSLAQGRVGYRIIRRVCRGPWCGDWASLFVVEVMSASISDLRKGRRGRRSYQVRWAAESDVPAVTAFFGPGRPIMQRVRRGDRCLIATVRGEICAAVWFSPGPGHYAEDAGDLGCELHYPETVAFSYDGLGTRLGAWGTLMARAPDLLQQIGVDEIVTLIDYDNYLSINSHQSLGYRRLGLVGCLGLAQWMQPFYGTGRTPWRMLPGRLGPLELHRASKARVIRAPGIWADIFCLKTAGRKLSAVPSPQCCLKIKLELAE